MGVVEGAHRGSHLHGHLCGGAWKETTLRDQGGAQKGRRQGDDRVDVRHQTTVDDDTGTGKKTPGGAGTHTGPALVCEVPV